MNRAWVLDHVICGSGGSQLLLQLKAWRAPDSQALRWHVGRIFKAAGYCLDGKNMDVGSRLRDFGAALVEFLAPYGFELKVPFFGRSLHALNHRSDSTDALLMDGEDDFWCTTEIGILLFIFFSTYRRGPDHKATALAALAGFVEVTLAMPAHGLFAGMAAPAQLRCGAEALDDGWCEHVRRGMDASWPAGSPQRSLVQQLVVLNRSARTCVHAVETVLLVLRDCSSIIDSTAEVWGDPRLERCRFIGPDAPEQKRRRVDPHLKEIIADKFYAEGRSGSTTASMKALFGVAHSDTGRKWEFDLLAQHQAAQWLSVACAENVVLGASMDGTNLGHPKVEHLLTNFWLVDKGAMLLAPPVDRSLKNRTRCFSESVFSMKQTLAAAVPNLIS